jgi:hypothetical protein
MGLFPIMATNSTLKMVRRSGKLYPKSDDDYGILHAMGVHNQEISADYGPLLYGLAKKHNVRVQILDFEALEEEMVHKVTTVLWKIGTSSRTANSLSFTFPRDTAEDRIQKLRDQLTSWYRAHNIAVEISVRRHTKNMTLTFLKAYES